MQVLYRIAMKMKEVKKTKSDFSREAARTATGVRRRKRKKRSYALYYFLLLFFVLVSGVTLSVTVFFNIEVIEVTGSKLHTAEEIISQSGLKKGDNLFRINTQKAEDKLISAFQDMDGVTVTRKFPSSLVIAVTDAQAVYYLPEESGYVAVSIGGRVLKQGASEDEAKNGTVVKGLDSPDLATGIYITKENAPNYELLKKLEAALKTAKLDQITEVNLENEVELSVCYQNRLLIQLGSISEMSYKLNFARNIIETKLAENDSGVIDASKAGKVYYNPSSLISSSAVSSDTAVSSANTASDSGSSNTSQAASASSAAGSSASSKSSP